MAETQKKPEKMKYRLSDAMKPERIEGKNGRKMTEHMRFLLEMYCQGSVYMTVQWVLGKIKATPEQMAGSLVDAMPAELEQLFRKLELI